MAFRRKKKSISHLFIFVLINSLWLTISCALGPCPLTHQVWRRPAGLHSYRHFRSASSSSPSPPFTPWGPCPLFPLLIQVPPFFSPDYFAGEEAQNSSLYTYASSMLLFLVFPIFMLLASRSYVACSYSCNDAYYCVATSCSAAATSHAASFYDAGSCL